MADNMANDQRSNIYLGLAFPIVIALMTVVVGALWLREPKNVRIWDEVGGEPALAPEPELRRAPATGG